MWGGAGSALRSQCRGGGALNTLSPLVVLDRTLLALFSYSQRRVSHAACLPLVCLPHSADAPLLALALLSSPFYSNIAGTCISFF